MRVYRCRHVLAAFLALCGFAAASCGQPPAPGTQTVHLRSGGLERACLLHLPPAIQSQRPLPLVIALHGAGGSAGQFVRQGRWIEKADREGFILAAPNGTLPFPTRRAQFPTNPRMWNVGPMSPGAVKAVDDVAFVQALIATLVNRGLADRQRVYVTGFSNGAAMCFRIGLELSDRVAAIAPVSNVLLAPAHPLKQPVSLLLLFGDADPLDPFHGGRVRRYGREEEHPSAVATWQTWAGLLKCAPVPRTVYQRSGVTGRACTTADGSAEAVLYVVYGMGHNWPGGLNTLPERLVGRRSYAIQATDLIWQFFRKHRR